MRRYNTGIHCFISGKVQGVFFRAGTQKEAKRLELTGYAANLPDGRLEVLAFGDNDNLQDFYAWLARGPEQSEITGITYGIVPWKEMHGFEIK